MQAIFQYYGDLYIDDSNSENVSIKRRVRELLQNKAKVIHIIVNTTEFNQPALTTVVLEDA